MTESPPRLRTFLDEGVPDSVGKVLSDLGHTVILHRQSLAEGATDEVVCAAALANNAILVAIDADMKQMAKRYGVTPKGERFDRLSVIRLCCNETQAASRLGQAINLIQHEWAFAEAKRARRMWVDVASHFIRTNR